MIRQGARNTPRGNGIKAESIFERAVRGIVYIFYDTLSLNSSRPCGGGVLTTLVLRPCRTAWLSSATGVLAIKSRSTGTRGRDKLLAGEGRHHVLFGEGLDYGVLNRSPGESRVYARPWGIRASRRPGFGRPHMAVSLQVENRSAWPHARVSGFCQMCNFPLVGLVPSRSQC